jgi:hypothetical protein
MISELQSNDHGCHRIYSELQDHIVGACSYCANAFGVKDKTESSPVKLLRDFQGHPSLHTFI